VWRAPITTLNVQISKKWSSRGSFEVFVNNLTDRRYKESFSDFLIQDGAWMPRITLGTTLTVYF
jgi:outer membrane receptor protein involved in Fe transport